MKTDRRGPQLKTKGQLVECRKRKRKETGSEGGHGPKGGLQTPNTLVVLVKVPHVVKEFRIITSMANKVLQSCKSLSRRAEILANNHH